LSRPSRCQFVVKCRTPMQHVSEEGRRCPYRGRSHMGGRREQQLNRGSGALQQWDDAGQLRLYGATCRCDEGVAMRRAGTGDHLSPRKGELGGYSHLKRRAERLRRFASADAVTDGLNWNWYVHGNPTTLIDPSGHVRLIPQPCDKSLTPRQMGTMQCGQWSYARLSSS
jgi:hypothetical protein